MTFEYERLVKEQTSHRNRIKALLFGQGVRDFDPTAPERLERLSGLPILPRLKAELVRECRRLAAIVADIAEIEAEMAAVIVPSKKADRKSAASPIPSHVQTKAAQLFKLKSIGVHFSTVLAGEVYYRTFRNGRGVGQISAWPRLPSKAATWRTTRGSPRPATSGRAKR